MDIFHDMLSSVRRSLCESPDVIFLASGERLYYEDGKSVTFLIWKGAVWVSNIQGKIHVGLAEDIINRRGDQFEELSPVQGVESRDLSAIDTFLEKGCAIDGLICGRALLSKDGRWYMSFWQNQRAVISYGRSGLEVLSRYLGGDILVELWIDGDKRRVGMEGEAIDYLFVPLDYYIRGKSPSVADAEHRVLRPE